MLQLLRVMFPYMLLVCLAAAMMGMLNARGHFFIPAMGATMLNVVMIASVFWLAPRFGLELPTEKRCRCRSLRSPTGCWSAGVAQAAFQMPTLWRDGFRYRWVSPWGDATVQRVVRQMIPGTIGVAAFQINVAMVQLVALYVGPGIVASFNGAVRLMELPQGVFGISLATYLLPTLSGLAAEKNYPEFRATLRHGLGTLMVHERHRLRAARGAGRADCAAVVRARRLYRRFHRPRGVCAEVPGARPRDVFHREHSGAGVLRAGRHPNADENQPGLPGHQFCWAAAR